MRVLLALNCSEREEEKIVQTYKEKYGESLWSPILATDEAPEEVVSYPFGYSIVLFTLIELWFDSDL